MKKISQKFLNKKNKIIEATKKVLPKALSNINFGFNIWFYVVDIDADKIEVSYMIEKDFSISPSSMFFVIVIDSDLKNLTENDITPEKWHNKIEEAIDRHINLLERSKNY